MEDSSRTNLKMPVMIKDIEAPQRDAFLKGLDELLL